LWPDRLCIALAPDRVELARVARRFRQTTVTAQQAAECRPQGGKPRWSAALATLGTLLAEESAGTTEARVTLSNDLARYLVLPWDGNLLAPDEVQAAAAQQFERVFGELAAGWEIRVSPCEFGQPALACAIDRNLLAGLQETVANAARGRIRLASVETLLAKTFNLLRGQIDRDGLLAIVEPACVALASLRGGLWHRVQVRRPAGKLTISRLVEQELALASADGEPSRIDLVELVASGWQPESDLQVIRHPLADGAAPTALLGNA
jgi:hypothetical protein